MRTSVSQRTALFVAQHVPLNRAFSQKTGALSSLEHQLVG